MAFDDPPGLNASLQAMVNLVTRHDFVTLHIDSRETRTHLDALQ